MVNLQVYNTHKFYRAYGNFLFPCFLSLGANIPPPPEKPQDPEPEKAQEPEPAENDEPKEV